MNRSSRGTLVVVMAVQVLWSAPIAVYFGYKWLYKDEPNVSYACDDGATCYSGETTNIILTLVFGAIAIGFAIATLWALLRFFRGPRYRPLPPGAGGFGGPAPHNPFGPPSPFGGGPASFGALGAGPGNLPYGAGPAAFGAAAYGARRAGKLIFLVGMLTLLVVLGGVGAVVFFAVNKAGDVVDEVAGAIPTVPAPGATAAPGSAAPPASSSPAAGAKNFLKAANFEAALADVREKAGPNTKVQLLRVDAGQVWVVCGNSRFSGVVRVTDNGTSVTENGGTITSKLKLEDVDPRAPERMLAALKKDGVAASKVDYTSLLDLAGRQQWGLFLKTAGATPARMYAADGHGRNLRKNG